MAKVIEELNAYGCRTEEALARFLNKESMYLTFLKKFLADDSFERSKEALAAGIPADSLSAVHTLKGVSGNLGLTPLYDIAADMVAKYRADDPEGADSEFPELEKVYHEVYKIIEEHIN